MYIAVFTEVLAYLSAMHQPRILYQHYLNLISYVSITKALNLTSTVLEPHGISVML